MAETGSIERLGTVLAGIDARCPEVADCLLAGFEECTTRYSWVVWHDEATDYAHSENMSCLLSYIEGFEDTFDDIACALVPGTPDGMVHDALREAYGRDGAEWLDRATVAERLSAGGIKVKVDEHRDLVIERD